MAILTSKGARAPHQLKGRRNVRISRDRRGCGNDDIEQLKDEVNKALSQCQKTCFGPSPEGELKYIRIKYKTNDEPTLLITFKGYTSILLNLFYYVVLLKSDWEIDGDFTYGFKSAYDYNKFVYINYDSWRTPKILNVAGDKCEIETITENEFNEAKINGKEIKPM